MNIESEEVVESVVSELLSYGIDKDEVATLISSVISAVRSEYGE